MKQFQGGQLAKYYSQRGSLTSDPSILSIIKGDSIEFDTIPPNKHFAKNAAFSEEEDALLDLEIEKLLMKSIIKETHHETNEFVYPIFTTAKSDGGIRLILNLKKFNEHIKCKHFKMPTMHALLDMVTKNSFMSMIDLKEAHYRLFKST